MSKTEAGVADIGAVARHPPTAHIPGLGPKGEACAGCRHLLVNKTTGRGRYKVALSGRCQQWLVFRGEVWRIAGNFRVDLFDEWWRGWGTIEADTRACKYWEARETPP